MSFAECRYAECRFAEKSESPSIADIYVFEIFKNETKVFKTFLVPFTPNQIRLVRKNKIELVTKEYLQKHLQLYFVIVNRKQWGSTSPHAHKTAHQLDRVVRRNLNKVRLSQDRMPIAFLGEGDRRCSPKNQNFDQLNFILPG